MGLCYTGLNFQNSLECSPYCRMNSYYMDEGKTTLEKTCCCDFYIYLPTKKVNMDCIFLKSQYKELNQLRLKPVLTCEGMWEGRVEVPVDMVNYATYQCVAQKKEGFLNAVSIYTSEWRCMQSDIQQCEFLPYDGYLPEDGFLQFSSSKEGYLTHCIHILNICNRFDVIYCISHVERICRRSFTFDEAVEIMAKLQSVISRTNAKGLILLAVIMMTNVRSILKLLDATNISKDKVTAMLESFKTTDFGNFSDSCRKHLPQLLQNLCMFLCGRDYDLLSFIYWTYPFLDENFFIDEIVHQVTKQKQLFLAEGQRYEVLQEVIFLIESRVDVNVQAVGLLERIFRHLPLPLAMKGYRYLFNVVLSSKNDIHNSMKEKLLPMMTGSFLTNMLENINQGRMPELLSLWEIVQDEEEISCKVREKLQQSLVSFLEKRTDKMSSTDLQSLHKMILDTKLFIEKNTHEQLLRTLGQSKVKNLHGLCVTFLQNSKFSDCLIQYPHLLLEWFETVLKQYLKADSSSSKENEILSCYEYLHDALTVPFLPPDGQLQMKLQENFLKWLTKIDVKIVLRKLEDIEKLNEQKPLVLDLYQKHVQKLLADQYKSSKPDDLLLAVCGTNGQLLVNSSHTSKLVQNMMEMYYGPFETDQYENFINMAKMSKFWMLLLKMEGIQSASAKKHEVFKKGMMCLNFIIESLESDKINCTYLEKFSKAPDVKELLAATGTKSRKEIDRLWKNVVSVFQKEREKVTCVMKVLPKVREVVPWNSLPAGWKNLEEHIKDIDKMLKGGKFSTGYVMDSTLVWSNCLNLPDICQRLFCYIDSQVFWNACLHILADKPELSEQREQFLEEDDEAFNLEELADAEKEAFDEETRILESLKHIFTENDHESGSFESCVHFLEVLEHHGGLKYREDWMLLCKDEDVPMTHVLNMFKNDANIVAEISFQEKSLKLSIENWKRHALFGYHKFNKYLEQMKAMEITLCALEIPLGSDHRFLDAKRSFDKLMTQSIEEITLEQVYEAIKTIHIIAKSWGEDEIQVLRVLGESTLLVQFLKDVADVDLWNLTDAVEEVSEQSVNETTVLGLIDVKRFLQPVLKKNMESDLANLFRTISKQMKEIKPIELVGKIIACRENLHNLKSLYSNVANRGLKTREIIDNVIKMGKFCFEIDTGDVCILSVEYTHSKKMTTHGQDTLIDLRSRALLMMNTDSKSQTSETTKKKETLDKFVMHMDTALEIGQLLTNLHMSGHFQYKLYQTKMKASGLKSFKDKLNTEYSSWCARLEECREKHYWMNFILGNQLHIIHDFLEMDKEKQRVLSMLQFIHPDIKIGGMKEHYSKLPSDGSESSLIENIALTLEDAMKNLLPVSRHVDASLIVSPRITDIVRPGKLSIVALEENSKLIMKTMLALYYNTVKKLPEPHQILFCNQDTTWVEVQLLLHRSVRSQKKTLFCIANVEMLSNEIQFQLVEALHHLSMYQAFLLAVVCCGTEDHPFVNEFSDCVMPVHPLSDTAFRNILQKSWPDVCSVSSDVPGLGKTEMIRQRSHKKGVTTFHISGPLNKARLVERLADMRVGSNRVLHVDIGNVDNPMELDAFLFEIIVLGFASAGRSCVCLPTKYIFIEIANTMNNQLKDALQTAMSFRKENLSWQDYENFIVSSDINSPVQVVCQYLNTLEDGTIDMKDIYFTGKKAVCPLPRQKCQQLLRKYFPGPRDMSFNIVRIFINVLADQLKKMSCSAFFRTQNLRAALGVRKKVTVKSNLLYALLNTSREFASRSVNNCRILQASAGKLDSESKAGELSSDSIENSLIKRVEGMIRWEGSNHLIFVFHNQDVQTLSAMYRNKSEVPNHIKDLFESQVQKPLPDFKSKTSSELQDILQRVVRTNPAPLSKKKLEDLGKDYALTPDNLLKMILIMLRIKAHIPVIIMGETGCGKTSLVRYLSQICEVSLQVVQVHAGIEEDYILARIQEVSKEAELELAKTVWLFLDEINTCNYLGLICDILCHHKCLGKTLPPNLVVMAACNPYKLRPEKNVLTAGLQGKIKTDEMSRLVYRVFPIPETVVDYVWDFGSISEIDEEAYVHRMIQNVFKGSTKMDQLLADLAIMSQRFVRKIEDSESSVSLRDVNRCKLLAKWFQDFQKKKKVHGQCQGKDFQIRCIILALAHCYHSRFANAPDRKTYRNRMVDVFRCHEIADYDEDKIQEIITEEQRDILNRMELPVGTAQNSALQENVFVILVCILNRIPIFVVGKPGCSKSLSMQVIRSNLRGKDSKDPLFKSLPQLNCVSFQGSESSTSDGIIKVFEKAQRYQEKNNPEEVLSVVILDEIGLAEISRFNPLKVLHSLLEPEGKLFPELAVVGISNWALDAAKMNRAIHLSRPEMNVEELILTGKSISKSMEKKPADSNHELMRSKSKILKAVEIDKELKSLADSYMKYIEKQTFANFHGLRDYYSLVKYIAKTLSELQTQETTDTVKMKFITRGLQRNFGGLPSELSTLQELFKANLQSSEDYKVPVVDLIVENVQDKLARHLMLITSGDSALDILEQQLVRLGREKITIYGSRFEEDLTDDYNYRILNKIIICMEQGLVLILKDLDSIYGSLYDMLNQNYTVVGEKKNCRVALGPYSNPMCQVHDDFRCIVLVDESKIDHADPPFLNRFEKQNLKFAAILSQSEHAVINNLENWVQQLTNVQTKHFEVVDVFPVYSADMVPSLVHRYFLEMEKHGTCPDNDFDHELTSLCKQGLLWIMKPESIVRLAYSEFGTNPKNAEEFNHITNDYIHLPTHEGLGRYFQSEINEACESIENNSMFMIFTNSNIHTNVLALLPDVRCQVDKLGAFKSEKQLTYRLQQN